MSNTSSVNPPTSIESTPSLNAELSSDSSIDSGFTGVGHHPLRAFIAGATGFCGSAVVTRLADSPRWTPLPHLRPSSTRRARLSQRWDELGVQMISCEWDEVSTQLKELAPQVIMSFIGTTRRQAQRGGGGYQEIDYGLNHSLIEAARELSTPPLMIYLSSMGVEWSRWSAYLKVRADIERELTESGLPHLIIRPALLSGPSRDEPRLLEEVSARLSYSLARLLTGVGLRKLAYRIRPLDAPEVAKLIQMIAEAHLNGSSERTLYRLSDLHELLAQA